MTDRELLELAAKAAGMAWSADPQVTHDGLWITAPSLQTYWNPLTDDGDALRLAVKLGIKLTPYPLYSEEKRSVIASRQQLAPPEDDNNTYIGPSFVENYEGDLYAATRRAIVRAAAEIGKAMP